MRNYFSTKRANFHQLIIELNIYFSRKHKSSATLRECALINVKMNIHDISFWTQGVACWLMISQILFHW